MDRLLTLDEELTPSVPDRCPPRTLSPIEDLSCDETVQELPLAMLKFYCNHYYLIKEPLILPPGIGF